MERDEIVLEGITHFEILSYKVSLRKTGKTEYRQSLDLLQISNHF